MIASTEVDAILFYMQSVM